MIEVEDMIQRKILSICDLEEYLPNIVYSLNPCFGLLKTHADRQDSNDMQEKMNYNNCSRKSYDQIEHFDMEPEDNFKPKSRSSQNERRGYLEHYFAT